VKTEIPRSAVEARWGSFFVLQSTQLLLSWLALVARRSWSAASWFWIVMEDHVLSADVACGWRLLARSLFFLAMVARREATVMLWRPLFVGFCLQGATELLFKNSIE
jgi:hypothetical protein